MSQDRVVPLTDVLARALADGQRDLHSLRSEAAQRDERANTLPIHAVEAILEHDDRFEQVNGLWQLAADAPVAGTTKGTTRPADPIDAPGEDAPEGISEFVVLDTETTGPDPTVASLIEIAAIRVHNWVIVDEFTTLVYADEIPAAVTALTGIEQGDIRSAPGRQDSVQALVAFVGDSPLLGQNIAYDLEVIQRVDPAFTPEVVLELLDVAHIVFPTATSRALDRLAELTSVDASGAHRAREDCQITLQVAGELVQRLNQAESTAEVVRRLLSQGNHPWSRVLAAPPELEATRLWFRESAGPWKATLPPSSIHAPSAIEAFGPQGIILKEVPGAEPRPAQLRMAIEVETMLAADSRLLAEAPTGTGKTYAYLIPALQHARHGKQVWVSTHTKALQTQLQRDFDRLENLGIIEGSLAVLKGQENYLCPRDLLAATETDLSPGATIELATLISLLWEAEEGEIGEVTDFWLTSRYPDAADIRRTVRLNPATCERSHCDFYEACPYYKARSRAENASIVAVNHALLVTEFGDQEQDSERNIGGLIIDEAHTLEDAATSILTQELDPRTITAWLDRLIDPNSSSGLLRNVGRGFGLRTREHPDFAAALEVVRRSRKAIRIFAERLSLYLSEFVGKPTEGGYPVTHRFRIGVDDRRFLFLEARQALFTFGELTRELTQSLWDLLRQTEGLDAAERHSAAALRRRLRAEAARGEELIELTLPLLVLSQEDHVVFATWEYAESDIPAIAVTRAPIDVGPVLRAIYDRSPSVLGTSATLSVGGSFEFMKERLAADDFTAIALPQTFDYASQAGLILTRHLPAPRADRESDFVSAVADTAIAAIGTARGGTLGLFTAKKRAAAAFELAEPGVRYEGLDLRAQLPGTSTRELADWFRETPDGSLFGLRSFWEGFDAPGDTLRLLLIEKIPFPSPADPLIAARSERMEAAGRDPFYELAVPIAALVFKQGFGRLIRTKTDRGAIAVLDRRLRTGLTYQAEFLASLPEGLPIRFPSDEDDFLTTLAELLNVEPRLDLGRGVGPKRSVADLSTTTIRNPSDTAEVRRALNAILELFGMSGFRSGQEELIRAVVVEGRDVVGLMPTGAGKSLIYQAAAMCLDGVGLVISPLIALMKDQVDSLRDEYGFRWAHALYGGQSGAERDEILDTVRQGGCRLLYVSPERLRDPNLMRALAASKVTFVAVDEAHCVSVWGHDFRPDFLTIVPALGALPGIDEIPRIALTATAPGEVLEDILQQLQLRTPVIERQSVDRPNLYFSVVKCRNKKEKRAQLLRVVLAHGESPGIVYCATRNDSEAAAALLRSHNVSARHYHAGMPPEQREAVQEMFMTDQVQVVCATNAFGLGIDKPDIGFVAHWSLPFSLDAYFQEAGRAARDPSIRGNAVLLWARSDATVINRLLSSTLPSVEDLEKLATEVAALPVSYATVEDLAERLGMDDISVRVGVHLLHRAGAIRQGLDVGARAFVSIPTSLDRISGRFGDETHDRVTTFVSAAGLSAPGRSVVDVLQTAAAMGIRPDELELMLLDFADREVLGYRPVSRAMSLHHTDDDWDRNAVSDQLRRLRRSAFDRLEGMMDYAKGGGCRRQRILQHFDEEGQTGCGACDVCAGEPDLLKQVDPIRFSEVEAVTEQVANSVLGLVREASRLNSTPGRGSFAKALKGVAKWNSYSIPTVLQRSRHFGSLRYLSETEIQEAIDTLLVQGRLIEMEHQLSNGDSYTGLDVRA